MMMSSETSCPESMTFFAARPMGVPAFTAARSMSPVEICGILNRSLMKFACVPLPAPGGPRRISLIIVLGNYRGAPPRRPEADLTVYKPGGQTAPLRVPGPRPGRRRVAGRLVAPGRRARSRAKARAAARALRILQAASARAADSYAGNRRDRHGCRCAGNREARAARPVWNPQRHPGPRALAPG